MPLTGKSSSSVPAWTAPALRNPHAVADKRQRVRQMFAAIAQSYDLNNRLHSLWMDQHWRSRAVELACLTPTDRVVDVACGTGDLALKFERALRDLNDGGANDSMRVVGVDFTFEMLALADAKARREARAPVAWVNGDAMALPLPDACADVVSIAFGIRNVARPAVAIGEFFRVLKPGGRLIILEFSLPENRILRTIYNFYFRKILPHTATWISGDRTGAYKYLPESVNTFIGRAQMVEMMAQAGFGQIEQHPLTFGVCVCYRGVKR